MTDERVYELGPIDAWEDEGWTKHIPGTADVLDDAVFTAMRIIETAPRFETPLRDDRIWWMRLPMPGYADAAYAVAVKIDNNGTTFIWSPVELPWLRQSEALGSDAIAAIRRARERS